ncbi:family 43 glycosylhydrolase [Allorhizocola rhizosphaerae]|uniref:family 43 glycosylhydrolase n=1 Tax=Allorhizocola rhizosphaerae TaxID=1872709 RepID=UPI0013C3295A|nr:family 43 glycosylhydrolase [Allorhizocola rhizosphaerae]
MSRKLFSLTLVLVLAGCHGDTDAAQDVTSTSATLTAWGVPETSSTDFFSSTGRARSLSGRPRCVTPTGSRRAGNNFNPLWKTYTTGDYQQGDVKIVRVDGRYYASGSGCTLRVSPDLRNWDYVATHDDGTGHQVPTEVCGSARGMHPPNGKLEPVSGDQNVNYWGTEVTRVGATWVLVTSFMRPWDLPGRHAGYSRGAIYVATACNPAGPYTWASDAAVRDPDSTLIDPSVFADPNTGRIWLTYVQHRDYPTWTLHNELRAIELDPANLTVPRAGAGTARPTGRASPVSTSTHADHGRQPIPRVSL